MNFAAHGASVHLFDLNLSDAESVAGEIVKSGNSATAWLCDVSQHAQTVSVFEKLFERTRLDILVNNAGISQIGNVETTAEADFDRILRVNVNGYYNCIFASVGHMKANGGGVILNMASVAGSTGLADRFGYSASKGAVIAMTYSVARDYVAHGIRCNCISPARVHTPFVDDYLRKNYPGREKEMFDELAKTQPIGRMGEPEEVAALALFLCSSAAGFVTGVNYPIDGGFVNLHG